MVLCGSISRICLAWVSFSILFAIAWLRARFVPEPIVFEEVESFVIAQQQPR